jgi:hypothetical protein
VFIAVMLPINILMGFLLATRAMWWTKLTAAAVILITLYTFVRGYLTRLTMDADGVYLRRPGRDILLPWDQIRHIGEYAPGGGVGGAEYVYVTKQDTPPTYKWEIDESTIQIQAHPGLLDALIRAQQQNKTDNPAGTAGVDEI